MLHQGVLTIDTALETGAFTYAFPHWKGNSLIYYFFAPESSTKSGNGTEEERQPKEKVSRRDHSALLMPRGKVRGGIRG